MTVQELISELKNLPKDYPVYIPETGSFEEKEVSGVLMHSIPEKHVILY